LRDGVHVSSAVAGEQAGGVLEDQPAGTCVLSDAEELGDESGELVEQAGAGAGEPGSLALSDGEVLAGEAAHDEVGLSDGAGVDVTDVSLLRDTGEVAGEHGTSGRDQLALPDARHTRALEAEVKASDSGERGVEVHEVVSCRLVVRRSLSCVPPI
jgi:hypothetical protein